MEVHIAEDLQFVIGASIGGLIAGLRDATESVDAFGNRVTSVFSAFAGLGEAFLVGLGIEKAIEKTVELAEHMGKLAENANNMGAVLGITGQQFQVLTEAMEIVDLSGDALGRTFRILSSAADTAIGNPLSRQADAFRKLGIDAQEFAHVLRSDPEKALDILNEKFKEFGGAGGIEGPFGVLLGRSGAQVLKFFKEEIEDLKKKVQELGAPSQETIDRLDRMDDHFNRVSVAVKNLKFALADAISGPMNILLTTIEKIISALTSVINGTATLSAALRKLFSSEDSKNTVTVDARETISDYQAAQRGETHTRASENFTHFNYGNIKATTNPTTWREYDSPEAGVAAIEDWLRRHQKLHGQDTIDKILNMKGFGYAPAEDNPGKDLVGDMVRRTGFKAGQQLNMEDPEQLHKITAAILAQEGAPKTAFDALSNIGGKGDYNVSATKEVPEINSAALKKWTDEYLKGLDAQKKATDEEYKYFEQVYRNDAQAAAQEAQKKAQADLKYVDERKRIIGQLPEHIRKEYQDETGEAWKAATEVLKADQHVVDEKNKLAVQKAEADLKADQDIERNQLAHAQSLAKVDDQTADEFAATQRLIVDTHEAAQVKILQDALANAGLRKDVEAKLQAELNSIIQKASEERVKIQDKADEAHAKNAEAINKEIASKLSGGIVDLAWGKSTPGQAIASTAQDLEKKALDKVFEKLLDASGIGSLLDKAFQSTIGSLFSKGADSLVKGVTEAPVQAAANATAMAPLIATQTGALITGITGPIVTAITGAAAVSGGTSAVGAAGSLAGGAGGFFGFLKTLLTFEHGGIVPSAAAGWQVPNVGSGSIMAQLHANEMVLPSGISSFIQNAASSASGGGAKGNPVAFHYAPQINAPETPNMKQLLSRHGNDMLNWLQAQTRSGALRLA